MTSREQRIVAFLAANHELLGVRREAPIPHVTADRVRDVLTAIAEGTDREGVKAMIWAGGGPVYEADPEDPDGVTQFTRDGRRIRGRFENKTFVPRESTR